MTQITTGLDLGWAALPEFDQDLVDAVAHDLLLGREPGDGLQDRVGWGRALVDRHLVAVDLTGKDEEDISRVRNQFLNEFSIVSNIAEPQSLSHSPLSLSIDLQSVLFSPLPMNLMFKSAWYRYIVCAKLVFDSKIVLVQVSSFPSLSSCMATYHSSYLTTPFFSRSYSKARLLGREKVVGYSINIDCPTQRFQITAQVFSFKLC